MIPREQTRQNYDRMSRWYDLFAGSEKKFTETGLQILGLKAGERALEIGFGMGRTLSELAEGAGDCGLAIGVELSAGLEAGRTIGGGKPGKAECAGLPPVRVGA